MFVAKDNDYLRGHSNNTSHSRGLGFQHNIVVNFNFPLNRLVFEN